MRILASIDLTRAVDVLINGIKQIGKKLVITKDDIILDDHSLNISDRQIKIEIFGNANSVETVNGDIIVNGDVVGDVESVNGSITCRDVTKNITTVSGDVRTHSVSGKVSTVNGDIYR